MGLAASQGRYLCLTARMSDLVYEGQQISQQRLALATQSQEVSDAYNEAMSNTVLQARTAEGTMQRLTYDVLTSQDPFTGLCMRLVDLNGNVVVPPKEESIEATYKNNDGEDVTDSFKSSREFISKYLKDIDSDKANELASYSMEKLVQYYNDTYPKSKIAVSYKSNINSALKSEKERFLYDENCVDPNYLQKMLESGQWLIEQISSDKSGWESIVWQGSNSIYQENDSSDDAAAEAKYEADMNAIQRQDKILEMRLEQVQTQESAVEKEIESIKNVISKNVEKTFGTFA